MFDKWINEMHLNIEPVVDSINESIKVYADAVYEELKEEFDLKEKDKEQMDNLELICDAITIDSNHQSFASMDHNFFNPRKSEIKRSRLYGIDERTRFPAKMGFAKTPEGVVDVMQKAREPYGVNNVLLNGPVVDQIIDQAMSRIMTDSTIPRFREVLSLEQCIYGDRAYNLNSINWDSSCGFYLRLMKDGFKQGWKAKHWMRKSDNTLSKPAFKFIKRLFDHYELQLIN